MINKDAIKNIKAFAYYVDEPMPEDVAKAFDMAIKALEERPTGEWIPVKTRLPDENGFYLVTVIGYGKRPHMRILGYDAIGKKWGEGGVVAWCNISPYEQEANHDSSK